jgi:2-polyprenyl-3-methyl-5-hydroxy-6-metoxy-1,4-benzoquinol methylase
MTFETVELERRREQPAAYAPKVRSRSETLSARLEPFDSFWQAPKDLESGFASFAQYYRHNYLGRLPKDRNARILCISCGPGYLLDLLKNEGYTNVFGIDSDEKMIQMAQSRGLDCRQARAFEFLAESAERYDAIVPEQELNHLTLDETVEFLELCRNRLKPGGTIIAYGLNGANPMVGAENLSHNIDHFNTYTEYSLNQVLSLAGFSQGQVFPLKLYVFYKNPLNYVGLVVTGAFELLCRIMFKLYGKNVKVLSKKLAIEAKA